MSEAPISEGGPVSGTSILERALDIVQGGRSTHGAPERALETIADLWNSYLDDDLTPVDVAVMMILLKIARLSHDTGNIDNYVDIAGYAAIAAEVRG